MEYIVYVSVDFGELRVCFETEEMLKDDNEILECTLKELEKSPYVNFEKIKKDKIWFEIESGETLENQVA